MSLPIILKVTYYHVLQHMKCTALMRGHELQAMRNDTSIVILNVEHA